MTIVKVKYRINRFTYPNIIFIITFPLGLFLIGILLHNCYKTSMAEGKLVNNCVLWMHWIWNHIRNFVTFKFITKIEEPFIVCYYTIEDNINYISLIPNYINPYLCTHIIIGFASVYNCMIDLGNNLNVYKDVVKLKKIHPNLKVMVSVDNNNNSDFQDMVLNHSHRKIFIQSVLNVTKIFNLDGLDLDWEFPAWAIKPSHEKIHFAQLIYELRKEFDHSGQKLILSAAVAAPRALIDQCYEVPTIAEHIDFVNLMSYDYHFYVWYYPVTDFNSPLYPHFLETGYLTSLNVNFSANYWVLKGMPRKKIVIGIPLYGHSYKLYNPSNHKIQAPASGYGDVGYLGYASYPQVCLFLKNGAVRVFVNDSHVPYAYKDNEWISYDDISSISSKAKWIKTNGFKGAMVYSLNMDDWNSTCSSNYTFPLTNTIKDIFIKK
ncbi:PREDICTED: acidic mammalian chitinase [Ceratosolen solmsi marchali]|uniref:Acidic mammalian chitinase n=1 Tax=Ceratosolen solmsi marchali TaxID=326594 RepID=A0AAJ6YSF7_9HYME|nr:PREDICTED: acidic mammalian chitinase [Ceratosolen solmsi marchali]